MVTHLGRNLSIQCCLGFVCFKVNGKAKGRPCIKIKRKIIDQWQFSPFTKQVDIREARAEVKIVHIRELEFGETRIARCYDQLKDGRSELLNVTHIKGYWCYCLWPSQTWISGVLSSIVNVVRSSRTPIQVSDDNHCNWFFFAILWIHPR